MSSMFRESKVGAIHSTIFAQITIAAITLLIASFVGRAVAQTKPKEAATEQVEGKPTERTVESLFRACLSDPDKGYSTWCEAYLMGVADVMVAFGKGGHKGGICGVVEYSPQKLADIFTQWTREHREFWRSDMLLGVHLSLREEWPCS